MNIFAHLKIADLVLKKLDRQHGIRLNRLGFLLGNILPDIQHGRVRAEHFFQHSWPHVQSLALQIGREQQDYTAGRLTSIQSIDIGMVCHFVSDYFCYAHTNHFKQTVLNHLVYEARQSFVPVSKIAQADGDKRGQHQDTTPWQVAVQHAVTQHHSQQPSMVRDLQDAVEHGTRVALPNIFRINAALNDFKPDVIHLMTEFNMGLTGLNYAIKNNIPVISNYSTNFSQYTNYYKIDLLRQGVSSYMNWFHNQSQLTTCPSKTAEAMLHTFGVKRTAIFTRGIDAERFSPMHRNDQLRQSLGLENKVALLYVGRIAPEKDLDVLRQSYTEIERRYPGQTTLVVVGDGPMLETCRQTFPAGTLFTGFKKGYELAQLYASCDIFISPSSTETFGNVVLEAMASGLAVIGANAGGVGEIIRPMNNGLHFEARSVESLTRKIETLLTNQVLREQLQRNGRKFAFQHDGKQVIHDLLGIYRAVIDIETKHRMSV